MSAPKHTPGPWVARKTGGAGWPEQRGFAIYFNEAQEQVVDFVYEEADARLIAAAPELLEALEHIREYWNRDHNDQAMSDALWRIIDTADEAIAKAKGESA